MDKGEKSVPLISSLECLQVLNFWQVLQKILWHYCHTSLFSHQIFIENIIPIFSEFYKHMPVLKKLFKLVIPRVDISKVGNWVPCCSLSILCSFFWQRSLMNSTQWNHPISFRHLCFNFLSNFPTSVLANDKVQFFFEVWWFIKSLQYHIK